MLNWEGKVERGCESRIARHWDKEKRASSPSHAWGPFMFKGWKSYDAAIPGNVKGLELAGDYGLLSFYRWNWCVQPIDRAISVEGEKD
jgi:hypothetical protein